MKKGLFVFCFFMCLCVFFFLWQPHPKMIDLRNETEKSIQEYAEKQELSLKIEKEYHDTILEGHVISQSIKVGEKIKAKDLLIVVISLGKKEDVFSKFAVNELGEVPIIMYHGIWNLKNEDTMYTKGNVDKDGYQRTKEAFVSDLEMYYQEGYRMIALKDYQNGIIDVPLGKSPIILTFDDGLQNNFKVLGRNEDGSLIIDPNSAIGILEEFKKKYPDFQVTATFFLNGSLFGQPEYNDDILKWLIDHQYDIGNHTLSHVDFTKVSYERSIKEVGGMYQLLEEKVGKNYVPIVALPFGSPYKKTNSNFQAILSGEYNGFSYQTISTLQVGFKSNVSPFDQKFDAQFLKRIRAYDNNGKNFDLEFCFQQLKNTRYISDGDVNQITIPKELEDHLNKTDKKVVLY